MRNCFYKVIFCVLIVVFTLGKAEAQLTAVVHIHPTTCGLSNGEVAVYPSGGNGSYTYEWSVAGTANTVDSLGGLIAGLYTITVTSGGGSIVESATVAASNVPTLSIIAQRDTICIGSSDLLTAAGATMGGYTWSGGTLVSPVNADSISISVLSSGTNTYTLTWGPAGCPASATVQIAAYAVNGTLSSSVQPSCGTDNGKIFYTTSAPNGHIFETTLLRNDTVVELGTQTQFSSLAPGSYLFIVSDPSTGCTDTLAPVVLADNSTYPVISNVTIRPDSCFGNNNGAITVTVTNCASGCTYSWGGRNPGQSTDSLVHIPAGIDTFSVHSGGCSNIDTIITVPGPPSALHDSLTISPSHCGRHDGFVIDSVTGGTPPYTYVWSIGTPSGDSVTGLPGDTSITLMLTDSHGCTASDSAKIGSTPGPHAVISVPDTICEDDNTGILILTPRSPDGPFTYIWSNAQITTVNAGLSPGLYTVTMTDAVGCDTVMSAIVPAWDAQVSATFSPSSSVTLGQTMVINLQINVPPTNIRWDPYINGSTGNSEVSFTPQLQDSMYIVTVYYGQSCRVMDTLQIHVTSSLDGGKWAIPNTFTPNGDGINDNFKIISGPDLSSFHIWIFDRWGNKVFDSTDPDFLWNGTDQYAGNSPMNTGVYSYVIQYQALDSNSKGEIGGNISLIK
jgi:gliding motility-associated-like protein